MGTVEEVLMNPRHPYTQLLKESIPQADPSMRWNGKVNLNETEQEEYLKEGCRFAGRCPLVMDICRDEVPADMSIDNTLVKCHKYTGEIPLEPV
jgi:peptide/nickel transport system ATP-binding protein